MCVFTYAWQRSTVGGRSPCSRWVTIVVVPHFDKHVVAAGCRSKQRRPQSLVDETVSRAAIPGQVANIQGRIVIQEIALAEMRVSVWQLPLQNTSDGIVSGLYYLSKLIFRAVEIDSYITQIILNTINFIVTFVGLYIVDYYSHRK